MSRHKNITEPEIRDTEIPNDIVERWQRVIDSISNLLSIPCVMINRIEPPELEIFRSSLNPDNPFPSGTRMPMSGVYCEMTVKERHKIKVTDARKDPRWAGSPTVKQGIFAYLGYPLFWPDGKVFGTICAVDIKENRWNECYEALLLTVKDAIEAHLSLIDTLEKLDNKNLELAQTFSEVKALRGLLPICSSCKKIRDDKGYWNQIETYITEHSEAKFSHGICPDCEKKYLSGLEEELKNK